MGTWKKVLTAADITALGSGSIITSTERTKLGNIAESANNYVHPNHTGDVTSTADGATVIGASKVLTSMIANDAVTEDKLANAINDEIGANTLKVTNATHTGDVTGATALTIGAAKVLTSMIANDNVTADKLADSINSDIATGVTANSTANAALPKAGGAMTGPITTNSTFDGVDIAVRDAVLTSTTTTANAALPKAGGTMSGAIAMGTAKITGLGDPTADQDAATKTYVDTAVSGATDNNVNNANLLAKLAALESTNGSGTAEAITIGASSDDTIVITGNLQVSGSTTTVNSETLTVVDHIITAAFGSASATAAGTAGLEIATGDSTQLPFVGFVNGAGLTEMVVKAEGLETAFPIAIMEFGSAASTAPTGDSGGVGAFHFNTTDGALYIRTV
jgi:hypothetical protein